MPPAAPGGEARQALAAGIGCYLIWGVVPLYFQLLGHRGAGGWEILAHRTAWAAPAAFAMVLVARQQKHLAEVLRSPRTLMWLFFSSLAIAANWVVFIFAVNNGQLLESSLGYYINPLVNMAAGAVIFRERIDRWGAGAIGAAAVGVVIQALALGHLPLISLTLAFSFGAYGVLRKMVQAEAQTGLFVECLFVGGIGAAYAVWLELSGGGHFMASPMTGLLLALAGPITAVPLALFAWAARRMPLSAMGFIQFMSPTISFAIGVIEGEPFTPLRALSFVFIWGGAAIFAYGAWRRTRVVQPSAA